MQVVYNAQSLLDARIVADELLRRDIHAEIFGGHLQGGMGELPAAGLVRVMVADEDLDRAGRIVAEWERTTTENAHEQLSASTRAQALAGFTLGLITGIAGTWLFVSLPEAPRETLYFDYNQDRQTDAWQEMINGRVETRRRDRDFDGRPDAWWEYDTNGRVSRARLDNDFDGHAELTLDFRDNLRHRGELDADDNGLPEMTLVYQHGLLAEKQVHHPRDGAVTSRHYFRQGKYLERSEYDYDGDGRLESRFEYDAAGRPVPQQR